MPNHTPEHLFFRLVDSAQGCDFALIFGDLNHNKKLSEIMPPTYQINVGKQLIHFSEMIFFMNHLVTLYQLVKQRKMTHAMNFSTRKFGEIKVKCDISQWLQIL